MILIIFFKLQNIYYIIKKWASDLKIIIKVTFWIPVSVNIKKVQKCVWLCYKLQLNFQLVGKLNSTKIQRFRSHKIRLNEFTLWILKMFKVCINVSIFITQYNSISFVTQKISIPFKSWNWQIKTSLFWPFVFKIFKLLPFLIY